MHNTCIGNGVLDLNTIFLKKSTCELGLKLRQEPMKVYLSVGLKYFDNWVGLLLQGGVPFSSLGFDPPFRLCKKNHGEFHYSGMPDR